MLGIFLDTETTGLNPYRHYVLELAYKIIDLASGHCLLAFEAVVKLPRALWEASDKTSLQINGFTWEEISLGQDKPLIIEKIISDFAACKITRTNAVFICQNPSFDRAFFAQLIDADQQEIFNWPYHWLDLSSMFWAKHGAPVAWENGLSKNRIAAFYHLPKEVMPHRAMNGVNHLLLCYQSVCGFPLTQLKI